MPGLRIFLSYRRQDMLAVGMVGRIHEKLAARYGKENVFMDVDTIPPGQDFRQVLDEAVSQADVFIAVMGPQWLGLIQQRSEEASDFVRFEVETALRRKIPVVPLLIGNARMPEEMDLPGNMRRLAFSNAFPLDPGRDFSAHMSRLIGDLDRYYGEAMDAVQTEPSSGDVSSPVRKSGKNYRLALAISTILLGAGAFYLLLHGLKFDRQLPTSPEGDSSGGTRETVHGKTIVEFSNLNLVEKPGHMVAAAPHLNLAGISIRERIPPGSSIAIVNNLSLYNGDAIRPQDSENFLSQFDTENEPASFTLQFKQPLKEFTFVRPALYPATESGITHPAWKAHALDAAGEILSSQSEGLTRAFEEVEAGVYTLRAPGLEGIKSVRFESDPRLNGVPFAAFSALLIERFELTPDSSPTAE